VQLYDDFWEIGSGRSAVVTIPSEGWALVTFIAGKIVFLFLAFGLPLLLHPLPTIILYFGFTSIVMGLSLAVVFQLAHASSRRTSPSSRRRAGSRSHGR